MNTSLDQEYLEYRVPDPVSTGVRLIHLVVDSIVFYILLIIVFLFLSAFGMGIVEEGNILGMYLVSFSTMVGYYALLEGGMGGITIGKLFTGCKVVNEDGSDITMSTALKRSLSRLVPFEAFSYLGNELGWHDTWTKTIVVKKKELNIKQ
jgi:uncharacterized RDD family membrane protein YckC